MDHVLWIGGPPGSGKTTIARLLARRHGLRLFGADERTWIHRDRAIAGHHSAARRWVEISPAQRWDHPIEELDAMSLHRERGDMFINDVKMLPGRPMVVAEGSIVPPAGLSSGAILTQNAIWLPPTEQLQSSRLIDRRTARGALLLARRLADVIRAEVAAHEAPFFELDGSQDAASIADLR